jgi:hypothetical protein
MMPLALGLLWLELQYLKGLLAEVEARTPLPIDFAIAGQAAPPPRRTRDLAKDTPAVRSRAVSSPLGEPQP